MPEETFKVGSFFSGCGGFDYGFHKEKFEIIFGNDFWKDAGLSFKANYKDIHFFDKKIQDISNTELIKLLGNKKLDLIIGGPPCQCFTRLNNNLLIEQEKNKKEDERRILSKEYIKKVKLLKPKIVLMENVRDMLVRKNKDGKLYKEIIEEEFKKIGYKCHYKIIHMNEYEVPQKRVRVIFFATNDKFLIKFLEENPNMVFPTPSKKSFYVKDALKKIDNKTNLKNHEIVTNDEKTLERIKHIPQGGYYNNLPEHLKTKKIRDGILQTVKRYGSYYRRLKYDDFSTTITNNYIIHPLLNRYLTNREKALIHSFPISYKFIGTGVSVSQQIANAVPPKFSVIIAKHIHYLLNLIKENNEG